MPAPAPAADMVLPDLFGLLGFSLWSNLSFLSSQFPFGRGVFTLNNCTLKRFYFFFYYTGFTAKRHQSQRDLNQSLGTDTIMGTEHISHQRWSWALGSQEQVLRLKSVPSPSGSCFKHLVVSLQCYFKGCGTFRRLSLAKVKSVRAGLQGVHLALLLGLLPLL